MPRTPLIDRLKNSRLVQALAIYVGASWAVIEVASQLQETLRLPAWVTPVAIVLLLVGLVVVLATAWVQSDPSVDRREAAGEVPEEWQVGIRDLARTVRRGQLPHLTWGRALLGGAVAFWLLFGFAGVAVLLSDRGQGESPSPETTAAEAGLAAVPWTVSGSDSEVYREGMISLLGTALDAAPGLRPISTRTVLARWQEVVGADDQPDLEQVLEVGRRAGAEYVLTGSAASSGTRVALVGELYHAVSGARVGIARAEGSPDSLMALVDHLALEIARTLLAEGVAGNEFRHLATLTTESLEALLAYLEGERHFRLAEWGAAIEAFERATRIDSSFALAHLGAWQTLGWDEGGTGPTAEGYLAAALRHRERLPPRERALLEAHRGQWERDVEALAAAERATRRYPDDPALWNAVGDLHVHVGQKALRPVEEGLAALERATTLAPGFAPYLIHLVENQLFHGDSASAAALVRRERDAVGDSLSEYLRAHEILLEAIHGDSAASRDALARIEEGDPRTAWRAFAALHTLPYTHAAEAVARAVAQNDPNSMAGRRELATVLVARGKVNEAISVLPKTGVWGARLRTALYQYGLIHADSLRGLDWGDTYPSFGVTYTSVVLGDTGTADAARAEFERELTKRISEAPTERLATGLTWYLYFLDGLRALETLGPEAAEPYLLEALTRYHGGDLFVLPLLLWLLGDVYEQRGDDATALDYFRASARTQPMGALRGARIADRLGDVDEARRLYRIVLTAWENADPRFQPWVEEARAWAEPVVG